MRWLKVTPPVIELLNRLKAGPVSSRTWRAIAWGARFILLR